jgi:hypothetical protein
MFWAPFLFVTDVELPTVLKKSMQTFIQIVMKRNDCINKVTVSPVLPVSLDRIFMKSKGSWMTAATPSVYVKRRIHRFVPTV